MKGVTIRDRGTNNVLTFDLRDILPLLGEDAQRSTWTVRGVECVGGEAAEALHSASDAGETLLGNRLIELASNVGQIIDGEFSGQLDHDTWVIIRAVDSAAFDVQTDREEVLNGVRKRFVHVEDLA